MLVPEEMKDKQIAWNENILFRFSQKFKITQNPDEFGAELYFFLIAFNMYMNLNVSTL